MKQPFFVLICIVIVGFFLRYHNHLTWPREGATFDEYAWSWLGMNMLQNRTPISWSPHPQYTLREHYVSPKGTPFWLVQPYLEHPPLFGLITGSWAIVSGARNAKTLELFHIRGLALLLGTISIFGVFVLAKELYGLSVGLVASALYATIPTVVVGSRIVQNENFFIPIFLFMYYLALRFLKTQKRTYFYLSSLLGGLLVLSKVPWWAATVSVILLFCFHKKYTDAMRFGWIVALFFSLFFVWGFVWDWELFLALWKLQLARYDIAFDSILSLFTAPYVVDRFYLDGWIYVGWFSLFILMGQAKKHAPLLIALLGYFAIYILAIPNEPEHGWYRYPFYPFLVIALAKVIADTWETRASLIPFFIAAVAGSPLLQHTWAHAFGFSYTVHRVFLVGSGLTGLPLFFPGKIIKRICFVATICLAVVLVSLNIWAVLVYNEQ